MSTDRIRAGAGVVFALLGLALLWGGAGFSESAAAPGCLDDPACYAEVTEDGVVGPQGQFISGHTATCRGSCEGAQMCHPHRVQNSDGTTTWQCSCELNSNSPACSGFATVDGTGTVQEFSCIGTCDAGKSCRKQQYNIVTDRNCPQGYSLNRKCVCE